MDSNPICHPSPAKNMKCSFLYYIQLLMLARLVNGLEPHPPPLYSQKKKCSFFGLRSTSDDWLGWVMDSNPIHHPSPAKKMKCSFLDYVQLLMIGWAGWWTQTPSSTPLQPKKWNAHFCITFNIWCWPDWSMDLNLIHHSSPAKNMKCSFLGYIQLLVISWAVRWTQTPSATPLQPIKWNAHFWITFNFWWSAGLVNGLEPHPPPISRQKKWNPDFCITFNLWCWPDWSMDSNPIHHPSPAKKMKCFFFYYVHFWWSARLVDGLKPHPPPLSSQRNEMLIFWLCSTSDDWPGWSMDSNPICHPSPANKMNCSFLDYVQLLMISRACWWTQNPSSTSLQPKKWNAHFCIMFNF